MWKWECEEAKGMIVIVHGAGEHHRRYEWLARKWNEAGYSVIMGDLPGQGSTKGKRGHIDSFSQYITTVVDWYEEAKQARVPIHFLGHSMGGLVVIRTMMEKRLPVASVILSSPCLGLAAPPAKAKQLAAKAFHHLMPRLQANSGIDGEKTTRDIEIREAYEKDDLRVRKVSIRWYQELVKAMNASHKNAGEFPDVPLLILQAGEDYVVNKFSVRQWFNALPLSEKCYREWSGLYHEVFNEPEREKVFEYARSFIS